MMPGSVPGPFRLGPLPRITFGPGSVADIPEAVARHGRRVLLLTGSSVAASARSGAVVERIRGSAVDVRVDRVPPGEPTPETVDALVAAHRPDATEVVVGIGGGSVLDTAKAVAGLLRSGTSVAEHLEGVPGQQPYSGPAVPWVAVPTTAGTGSEVTRNAVVTATTPAPAKRSFRDERLVATEAVVDPDLLTGLTPEQIAGNGADALTQLLESYVSSRAMPITDALALDGLRAARDALPQWHAAVTRGEDDPDSRASMAYAALLSGICLSHTGLGVIHGLVAPLGAHTLTPHGAGCGALLAAGVDANVSALEREGTLADSLRRFAVLGRLLGGAGEGPVDADARRDLVGWLHDLTRRLQLPGLAHWGLTDAITLRVAALARTSSSMRTNPVELDENVLVEILNRSR